MMGFQRRHGAAQHQYGFRFIRLVNLYGLEAAGQRRIFSMYFLYSAQVVAPMVRSCRAPGLA